MIRGFSARLLFVALIGSTALAATVPMSSPVIAAPQVNGTAVSAVDAAFNGKYEDAGALAQQSGDPVAVKLVEFIYLRNNWREAGYSRIMAFLNAAPQWPLSETLLKRAEQSLYIGRASAETVLNQVHSVAKSARQQVRSLLSTAA